MALKDWSLISTNKREYHWRKGYTVVGISIVEKGSFDWDRYKAKYKFHTNRMYKPIFFKKKTIALKFAKSYMRTH